MKHRITMGDTTVLCNDEELQLLNSVCLNFTGESLLARCEEDESYTEKILFSELNVSTPDTGKLCVSNFGADGYKPNSIADIDAKRYYGVYFNVLIFLDGCDTFFRTDSECSTE